MKNENGSNLVENEKKNEFNYLHWLLPSELRTSDWLTIVIAGALYPALYGVPAGAATAIAKRAAITNCWHDQTGYFLYGIDLQIVSRAYSPTFCRKPVFAIMPYFRMVTYVCHFSTTGLQYINSKHADILTWKSTELLYSFLNRISNVF